MRPDFNNAIDAFHVVDGQDASDRFIDERRKRCGIVLADAADALYSRGPAEARRFGPRGLRTPFADDSHRERGGAVSLDPTGDGARTVRGRGQPHGGREAMADPRTGPELGNIAPSS